MHNAAISDHFSLLSKLIDIHGDDSFKAKSYGAAAFTIDKLPVQLAELPAEKIFAIKGIGQATGKKILELIQTGRLAALDEYILKTPAGILEMLRIKGLGPKKIQTIWKELGLETIGELLYACEENRLLLYKGFGAKTQQTIKENIEFYIASQGSFLYGHIESFAEEFTSLLQKQLKGFAVIPAGNMARHELVVHVCEWITDAPITEVETLLEKQEFSWETADKTVKAEGPQQVKIAIHCVPSTVLYNRSFQMNCSEEFFTEWKNRFGWDETKEYHSEQAVFDEHRIPFLPSYLREIPTFIGKTAPAVIQTEDIKGIIHTHSDWSDGVHTIEQMAHAAKDMGLEYLVISDHSQTATYAKGLQPERVLAQHRLIDELNAKKPSYRIFKSIESDILNDGSLDYPPSILSTFDLVITSVHSNLKMTEEKAMMRLLNAISNPFTNILGHMTGRLLLARNGYPVNHHTIIDACKQYNVALEINANPRRLDVDYHYLPYAMQQGVLLSIDPDAHSSDTFSDIRYGVLAAQKGGLTAQQNLSSFTLQQFENFLLEQHAKRK